MKSNFKTISTILIIVLVSLLIWILIKYYNTPIKVSNPMIELEKSENNSNTNHDNPIVIGANSSGEYAIENVPNSNDSQEQKTIINSSGEITTGLNSDENLKQFEPEKIKQDENPQKINDKSNQVIITSEDTMTNKEKREILTELDNTLMELLDVVDKVQTVDETRLITDESEVQR
ncbi:MAG: hypothetical protein IJ220_09300 [Clostridia bacterium]|nr:hypothetical protein [Clostridia bacterium]